MAHGAGNVNPDKQHRKAPKKSPACQNSMTALAPEPIQFRTGRAGTASRSKSLSITICTRAQAGAQPVCAIRAVSP